MTEQEMLDLFALHATDRDVDCIISENPNAGLSLHNPDYRIAARWDFARRMLEERRRLREMREETP